MPDDAFFFLCNRKRLRLYSEKQTKLQALKANLIPGNCTMHEYSVHEGVIFRGPRVVIPASLRPNVLAEFHFTHRGVVRIKALAQRFCCWKGIDNEIEYLVKACQPCCDVKKNP
jgi:hypothetical protein